MKNIPMVALAILLGSRVSHAEYQQLSNESGAVIEVKLIELKNDQQHVMIELRGGRVMKAALEFFSQESQELIKAWSAEQKAQKSILSNASAIEVDLQYKPRSMNTDDLDMRTWRRYDREYYKPEVRIKNKRFDDYMGNRVIAAVFAKPHKHQSQVLVTSVLNKTIDFPKSDSITLKLDEFELSDAIMNDSTRHGYEIDGFAIVIKNSKGETIYKRGSKRKWEDALDDLDRLKSGQCYNANLSQREDNRTFYAYFKSSPL
ncbi:MAG: hypothetical protein ACPGN3_03990 [Opitutales bacterium]